jgi:hypothetical protein
MQPPRCNKLFLPSLMSYFGFLKRDKVFVFSANFVRFCVLVNGNGGRPIASLRRIRDKGSLYIDPLAMIFVRKVLECSGMQLSETATFFKARITSATLTP